MIDLSAVLVLSLAVWRISSLLVVEDGPWDIFRRTRKFIHAGEFSFSRVDASRLTEDEVAEIMLSAGRGEGFLSGLLSCIWCTSIWVAAGVTILYLLWPMTIWLILVPALSAAAILVNRALE